MMQGREEGGKCKDDGGEGDGSLPGKEAKAGLLLQPSQCQGKA